MTDAGKPSVMLVDDRQDVLDLHSEILRDCDYRLTTVTDPKEALELVSNEFFDLLVLDDRMPGMSGRELFRRCRETDPNVGAIFVSAHSDADTLTDVIRLGVADYVIKSTEGFPAMFLRAVENALMETNRQRELRWYRRQLGYETYDMDMIGESPSIQDIRAKIRKVAPTEFDVLVTGQTGTGKELVARAIHNLSPRRNGPFLPCNLGGLESTLIASELFGATKGAFTGAHEARIGYFEAACGGTLFMDEIGELPLEDQSMLLRVLETREVQPVGTTNPRPVDLRVVAATNRVLAKEVKEGRFREDLFHRLNRFTLSLPPLTDRIGDIDILTIRFIKEISERNDRRPPKVTDATFQKLREHHWPGNVRELRNTLERAVLYCDGDELSPDSVEITDAMDSDDATLNKLLMSTYPEAKKAFEHRYCKTQLRLANGVKARAARNADVDRSTFYEMMRRCGLTDSDVDQDVVRSDQDVDRS